MKNIRIFVSENFQFLEVKVSIYLNRRVFVMQFCQIFSTLPVSISDKYKSQCGALSVTDID